MDVFNRLFKEEQESNPSGEPVPWGWGDLPHDILVIFHNKLGFPDQVRFRAVCKNWRIPNGNTRRRSDRLPWAMRFAWAKRTGQTNRYPFVCELFDPYSQRVYKVSNYIENYKNPNKVFCRTTFYASKNGWSLLGSQKDGALLFLHNPFRNEVITLPHLEFICKTATFTVNPTSPECEILVLCSPIYGRNYSNLYVGRCCLFRVDKGWSLSFLEKTSIEPFRVCYMKGVLYCLFLDGMLKSYNLVNKSWTLVIERLPEPYSRKYAWGWLIENGSDLLLAGRLDGERGGGCSIFKMDWSKMIWIMEPNFDYVDLFISGNLSLSAPFEDDNGEITGDYTTFIHGRQCVAHQHCVWAIDCYSSEERRQVQLIDHICLVVREICCTMSFIEPPYVPD